MFSRRIPWPPQENRLTALLREKRRGGVALLDLTESNPTRVGLACPEERLRQALASGECARYDPDPRGLLEAREAIARHCISRGQETAADRILLTASTSEAYGLLFKLLADAGDTFLAPSPSYPLFDHIAALESARIEPYALSLDDRFSFDLGALERAFGMRPGHPPRAVIVVNPNNPTGTGLRLSDREGLESFCAGHRLPCISDEVFLDYRFGDDGAHPGRPWDAVVSLAGPRSKPGAPSTGEARPLGFTLGGLSKSCGLPQLKLGWILVDGPEEEQREALERLEFIADSYLSVGAPVQRAAAALLRLGEEIGAGIHRRVARNRKAVLDAVPEGSPCRVLPADGGWSAVLQVPAVEPEEDLALALLAEDGVLVHPGYFFDFSREAYLVLSLLPEPEVFDAALSRVLRRAGHPARRT